MPRFLSTHRKYPRHIQPWLAEVQREKKDRGANCARSLELSLGFANF